MNRTLSPEPPVPAPGNPAGAAPGRSLSLFDATSLIVGIIVGVGIYQITPDVARGAGSSLGVLTIWVLGGLISLCGALTYAELATAYPRAGGDYVYLSRAYGPWAGFLFGWIQTVIVRPGDIAVMAFAFGTYAAALWDPLGREAWVPMTTWYAAGSVLVLTGVQMLGLKEARWTQNLLTVLKVGGLIAVVLVAASSPRSSTDPGSPPLERFPTSLAFLFVLFAYGGWNEMAYVAAEVKRPERNISRALWLGTGCAMGLYVLVNVAFLHSLGQAGVGNSKAVAADAVSQVFPVSGERFISGLICVSALGAVNGLIFAGARISYAVGAEHRLFRWLGLWNRRTGMPLRALLFQGTAALLLITILGSFANTLLYTAAPVYTFYLATSVAAWVLRRREPDVPRPYRVPLFPLPTLVFAIACIWLIYSAATYRPAVALSAVGLLLLGLPFYWWGRRSA